MLLFPCQVLILIAVDGFNCNYRLNLSIRAELCQPVFGPTEIFHTNTHFQHVHVIFLSSGYGNQIKWLQATASATRNSSCLGIDPPSLSCQPFSLHGLSLLDSCFAEPKIALQSALLCCNFALWSTLLSSVIC